MGQIIDSLTGSLGGALISHPGAIFWLAVAVGIATGVAGKLVRRPGATPVMVGIGMLVVSCLAFRYVGYLTAYLARPAQAEVVEEEDVKPLETIVLDTSSEAALRKQAGDLVGRLAAERRERKETAAKLRKAQWDIGRGVDIDGRRMMLASDVYVKSLPPDVRETGTRITTLGRIVVQAFLPRELAARAERRPFVTAGGEIQQLREGRPAGS
jgi:hypothetical protein